MLYEVITHLPDAANEIEQVDLVSCSGSWQYAVLNSFVTNGADETTSGVRIGEVRNNFV